eukprot:1006617-Prymnesium_polylepis.1
MRLQLQCTMRSSRTGEVTLVHAPPTECFVRSTFEGFSELPCVELDVSRLSSGEARVAAAQLLGTLGISLELDVPT